MRLITSEELEKKTTINGLQIDGNLKKVSEFFEAITKAIDTIKYYESNKAEPVVHGEWILDNNALKVYRCSKCGELETMQLRLMKNGAR